MIVIEIVWFGGFEVLVVISWLLLMFGLCEVLVEVCVVGVNGFDVFQCKGVYDLLFGVLDIFGLEIVGMVWVVGSEVSCFVVGEVVMVLIFGGGYVQFVVVDECIILYLFDGLGMEEVVVLLEIFMIVWVNLFQCGGFKVGEMLLVYGGVFGIGIVVIMLGKVFGVVKIFIMIFSEVQCEVSLCFGVDLVINYIEQDFVEEVLCGIEGCGVDVIVDIVVGDYVMWNYQVVVMNGWIVQIGVIKGKVVEVDLFLMLSKCLVYFGLILCLWSYDEKGVIIVELECQVWLYVCVGIVWLQVFCIFFLEQVCQVYELMDFGQYIGKIVFMLVF